MTDTSTDVTSFLFGGGGRSAKFEAPGDTVKGTVISADVVQQTDFDSGKPKFWDDGKPIMQIVVRLQTDDRDADDAEDDGVRNLYVKGSKKYASMLKAVGDAVRAAGAASLDPGGTLAVQYTGDGVAEGRKNPPKLYTAQYRPPAPAAVSAGLLDEL